MAVSTRDIQAYRTRELQRAEETLATARQHLDRVQGSYQRRERVEGTGDSGPFVVSQTDVAAAQTRVANAERTVAAWRLLLEQPAGGAHLTAITAVKINDRTVLPGETFVVPDDQAQSIVQLIEGGAAAVADPPPAPTAAAKLGSQELRKRLGMIDERRQRRREAFAEAEAELAAAQRALRDLEVRRELDGENVGAAIAKAEARVAQAERASRARRAAYDVEVERTEADRQTYETALAEAIAIETEGARQKARADAKDAFLEARRHSVRAWVGLARAIAGERAAGRELNVVVSRIAAETGVRQSYEPIVVDIDSARSMRGIFEWLAKLAETQECGLIPVVRYGDSPNDETYELEKVSADQ